MGPNKAAAALKHFVDLLVTDETLEPAVLFGSFGQHLVGGGGIEAGMFTNNHPAGNHAAIAGRGAKAKRPSLEHNNLAFSP